MAAMSAIVLAGDRRGSKLVLHENKAFLEFLREPLLTHVIKALLAAERVGTIVVVGPAARIKELLDSCVFQHRGKIVIIEQRENLLENLKAGYVATFGIKYTKRQFEGLRKSEHADTPALFMPCDVPLVTPWEIDNFIHRADSEHYEYTIGMTGEKAMEYYYPTQDNPGIEMGYYHLREGRCRHNNLHLGKPLKVKRLSYVEAMYEARYQTKFLNIVKLYSTLAFAGRRVSASLRVFVALQAAQSLYAKGGGWWYEYFRKGNSIRSVMNTIGGIMGLNMQSVFTEYGGATLDVDNAADLQVAEKMYDAWMAHQREIHEKTA